MVDPNASIALSAALFGLGILGVFVRRSPISVLMSLQLMLAASVLALVSFDLTGFAGGAALGVRGVRPPLGQSFGLLILSVATAQVTIGLGLMIAARREAREPGARAGGGL